MNIDGEFVLNLFELLVTQTELRSVDETLDCLDLVEHKNVRVRLVEVDVVEV